MDDDIPSGIMLPHPNCKIIIKESDTIPGLYTPVDFKTCNTGYFTGKFIEKRKELIKRFGFEYEVEEWKFVKHDERTEPNSSNL